jgi:aspartyl-tRNA synthetase
MSAQGPEEIAAAEAAVAKCGDAVKALKEAKADKAEIGTFIIRLHLPHWRSPLFSTADHIINTSTALNTRLIAATGHANRLDWTTTHFHGPPCRSPSPFSGPLATTTTTGAAVGELLAAKKALAAAKGEEFDDGKKKKEKKAPAGPTKKELRMAARMAQEAAVNDSVPSGPMDELLEKSPFGVFDVIRSTCKTGRVFVDVKDLTAEQVGKEVWLRAYVHAVRGKGKSAFFLLRAGVATAQATLFQSDTIPSEFLKFGNKLSKESVIDVHGTVVAADVTNATQKAVEISIDRLYVVSAAAPNMPFQLDDAMRIGVTEDQEDVNEGNEDAKGEIDGPVVSQATRLDYRWIDLRTPCNQAIFRMQSAVGAEFRAHMLANSFTEIHTPKLISTASEGGANVFKLDYFDTNAFLAQSPQLYKQMALMSGFQRVFEVGPVFRAENSNTNRHLTEFVGLDLEMEFKDHYHEVLDFMANMFITMFDQLGSDKYKPLREAVWAQFPSEPLVYKDTRIDFKTAVEMLAKDGVTIDPYEDLSSAAERRLGELVKEQLGSDFYILDRFPTNARPFYTMPCPDDERYSNSYDIFVRGQEIVSGAQRIHDSDLLIKRAA